MFGVFACIQIRKDLLRGLLVLEKRHKTHPFLMCFFLLFSFCFFWGGVGVFLFVLFGFGFGGFFAFFLCVSDLGLRIDFEVEHNQDLLH